MNIRAKTIIAGLLILVPCLSFTAQVKAFDLFPSTDCVTQSDGTQLCGVCKSNPDSPVCKDSSTQAGNPVTDTIKKVANIVVIIAGIAAVITIIISGFMFVTAGGSIAGQRAGDNPAKAAKARSALSASLVGLVVVALAWTIVTFVTDKFIH